MNNHEAILYGLATCDTCRTARRALESAGYGVRFRDVRDLPLSPEERGLFLRVFGDRLINRASTTWRGLSEEARQQSPDALLAQHAALMKRPVIAIGDKLWLGWSNDVQSAVLE